LSGGDYFDTVSLPVVVIDALKRVAHVYSLELFHYIKFLGILFRTLKDCLLYGR